MTGSHGVEGSNPSESTKSPKVLIAIISCHKNRGRRDLVRSTWLGDIPEWMDYKFFVGKGETELEKDVVVLDVNDSYEKLPFKVRAICKWAIPRGYDYMLKVDDDTYIYPERIWTDVEGHDYVGRHNLTSAAHCRKGFCSGFAYWLSRKAMDIVTWGDPDITWEDQWVGGWLTKNNILPTNNKLYYIASVIARPLWPQFMKMAHCFAEVGEHMKDFHDIAKGNIVLTPPLPATGLNNRLLDPRTGRQYTIGQVVPNRYQVGRTGRRVIDPYKPKK